MVTTWVDCTLRTWQFLLCKSLIKRHKNIQDVYKKKKKKKRKNCIKKRKEKTVYKKKEKKTQKRECKCGHTATVWSMNRQDTQSQVGVQLKRTEFDKKKIKRIKF